MGPHLCVGIDVGCKAHLKPGVWSLLLNPSPTSPRKLDGVTSRKRRGQIFT